MPKPKNKRLASLTLFLALTLTGCTMSWVRPKPAVQSLPTVEMQPVPDVPFETSPVDLAASNAEIENFTRQVQTLIKERQFKALDELAAKLSSSKERFIGGGWKIHSFYAVTEKPAVNDPTDDDWRAHLDILNEWKKADPTSIAARCSLAGAYISFAWVARGTEYADKVPPSAWPAVHERLDRAEAEIKDVSNHDQDGYGYFETIQEVAGAQGWDRNKFEAIFNDAIRFDPTYQYFYTAKASFLLPRWYGLPGEWEAFAENTKNTIGGDDGLEMYYVIVAQIHDDYRGYNDSTFFQDKGISWPATRLGFQLYEKQYGMTRSKLNRFAMMSFHAADAQTICKTFGQLTSDDFDPETSKDRTRFEQLRMMAKQTCNIPKFNNQAQ